MALTKDEVFWSAFRGHAEKSVKASALLTELMQQPADHARLVPEIRKLESEGDKITHDTVSALHQTWITPLDREEIHALVTALDDVLDFIEAVVRQASPFPVFPADIRSATDTIVLNICIRPGMQGDSGGGMFSRMGEGESCG